MTNQNIYTNLKLLKHLDKLAAWDKEGTTFPVDISIHLTNLCNNKCPLCMGRQEDRKSTIPFEKVKEIVTELKELGVKAVGLGGGGDASCHPDLAKVLRLIKDKGMETAIYTNGLNLSDDDINALIDCCTWIRISLDADCPETYKATHGMGEKEFYKVLDNVKKLVSRKKALNKDIVISAGYLVGPHTVNGVYKAAQLSKELGVDYIRIRPFYQGGGYGKTSKEDVELMLKEVNRCKELQDESFLVSSHQNRWEWMQVDKTPRKYKKCHIHHFTTIISANLKVYVCCYFENNEKYCLGDLKKNSFKEIWLSEKRKKVYENINLRHCPNPCMFDDYNRLLWDMKQPISHSNFL